MTEIADQRLTCLGLVLILAGSLALSLHNLGLSSFWIDELFHVFGAQSILEQGIPLLEGGRLYTRAFPYTYLVALFFDFFGVSEFIARMPSILFSTFTITGVFFITKKWFDTKSALVAAFLTAFSPLCVEMSRECRMYTAFQFTYLVMAYVAYEFIHGDFAGAPLRQFHKSILALALFALSVVFHPLAVLFIPTVLGYLFILAVCSGEKRDGLIFTTRYSLLFFTIGIFIFFTLWFLQGRVEKLWRLAVYLPTWDVQGNPRFYYKWLLEDLHPLFFYLYPVAVIFNCRKELKKGVYVSLLFVIPFLALSFAFPRKADRFLLPFFTFFLMAVSSLFANSFSWLWNRWVHTRRLFALVMVIIGFYFSIYPWLGEAFEYVGSEHRTNWARISRNISGEIHPDDVIITTSPLEVRHYGFRHHLYAINGQYIGEYSKESPHAEFRLIDSNTGVSMITRLDDLKTVLERNLNRDIWFLMGEYEFHNSDVVPLVMKHFIIDCADWYEIDPSQSKLLPLERPRDRALAIGKVRKKKGEVENTARRGVVDDKVG